MLASPAKVRKEARGLFGRVELGDLVTGHQTKITLTTVCLRVCEVPLNFAN